MNAQLHKWFHNINNPIFIVVAECPCAPPDQSIDESGVVPSGQLPQQWPASAGPRAAASSWRHSRSYQQQRHTPCLWSASLRRTEAEICSSRKRSACWAEPFDESHLAEWGKDHERQPVALQLCQQCCTGSGRHLAVTAWEAVIRVPWRQGRGLDRYNLSSLGGGGGRGVLEVGLLLWVC